MLEYHKNRNSESLIQNDTKFYGTKNFKTELPKGTEKSSHQRVMTESYEKLLKHL